ncbi:MAG: hypothetical protein AAF290_14165 [Pseudomonadota bacterium]
MSSNPVRSTIFVSAVAFATLATTSNSGAQSRWESEVSAQARWFIQATDDPRQSSQDYSVAAATRWTFDFDQRKQRFSLAVNGRLDSQDGERSQWDIGELNWRYRWRAAELSIGIDRVYWGVTEALQLVDTINQTNRVDRPDGQQKLGQPMIRLALQPGSSAWEFFILPVFREQRLPGSRGRLRGPLQLVEDAAVYESRDGRQHVDLAVRYSGYAGNFEWALSHFMGTSRAPLLQLQPFENPLPLPVLQPFYYLTDQTGLELTWVAGSWLWKLEAISRRDDQQRYFAATGGFETTWFGVGGSSLDLGLIAEYQYDDRDSNRLLQSVSVANDDLVLGARITGNDFAGTECLLLYSYDRRSNGRIASIEASRRFGAKWRGAIEARFFSGQSSVDALSVFSDEDFWQLELTRFF